MSSPTTTSSGFSQVFTPQSGSDRSTIARPTNDLGDVDADADIPLPSIEADENRRSSSSNLLVGTPSFSISSSGTGADSILTPSSSTEQSARTSREATIERLGGSLQHLNLSTPSSGASIIAAGMDSMEIDRRTSRSTPVRRESSLHPESNRDTPSRQSPGRRRRSGSQILHHIHNVADEQPPHEPYHVPAFQEALTNSRAQIRALQQVMGSSSLHAEPDSTIHNLYARAVQLGDFQCPSRRKVAFVGDSGVGMK
jgi:hypothetical protein